MGLLYVPEKKVTVAEILSKRLDQRFLTKVRAGEMFCFGHVIAALLNQEAKGHGIFVGENGLNMIFFYFLWPLFFSLSDMHGRKSGA